MRFFLGAGPPRGDPGRAHLDHPTHPFGLGFECRVPQELPDILRHVGGADVEPHEAIPFVAEAATIEIRVAGEERRPTQVVQQLEARLGVRLFHRTTRSVSLTAAGESFLARIEPALRAIGEAMEAVNEHRELPAGLLRINTSDVAADQMLTPIVVEFLRRYPDMQLEIITEGRLVDIVAGGFDGGVRLSEMVPQDMVSVPVGGDQEHVVVGSPLYLAGRRHPLTPADLVNHNCVRLRMGSGSIYRWLGTALSVVEHEWAMAPSRTECTPARPVFRTPAGRRIGRDS